MAFVTIVLDPTLWLLKEDLFAKGMVFQRKRPQSYPLRARQEFLEDLLFWNHLDSPRLPHHDRPPVQRYLEQLMEFMKWTCS